VLVDWGLDLGWAANGTQQFVDLIAQDEVSGTDAGRIGLCSDAAP